MLLLAATLIGTDSLAARAESLLAAHQLPEARALAEQLVRDHPDNEHDHLLLGRIWLQWPVTGRYDALRQFETAHRLVPIDPEPFYLKGSVGLALHTPDGDAMAASAYIEVFRRAPGYRDAWDRFHHCYQSSDVWRRADQAFAEHPADPLAQQRRAELAVLLGDNSRADSLGAALIGHGDASATPFLIRAEAAFQAKRDADGGAWYDSAMAHAARDSAGDMWNAVWMIASGPEAARYDSTPPRERPDFFRAFWEKRDPDLVTPLNERIPEHFRRLVYARRMFRLLFPNDRYLSSAARRALSAYFLRHFVQALVSTGCLGEPSGRQRFIAPDGKDAEVAAGGVGPDQLSVDSSGASDLMARSGFDARGLVWIRYGPPDLRTPGVPDPDHFCASKVSSPLDLEGWAYNDTAPPLTIAFLRATHDIPSAEGDIPAGDFLFMPITSHQVESAKHIMTTDRTAIAAPLHARAWSAFFVGEIIGTTDVYFKTAPDTGAMALWDTGGAEAARARGPGLMKVAVLPGTYDLGLDVDSSGRLGRLRQRLSVPSFLTDRLSLSSIVLAPTAGLVDRETALNAMPGDLTYRYGPLTGYAEIYGLRADPGQVSRYRVRYTFEPVQGLLGRALKGERAVVFEFTREGPARPVTPERLVIEPGRLERGRYRVTLDVDDLVAGRRARGSSVEIQVN